MFLLKYKGGLVVSEKEVGCWDNVPAQPDIESLAVVLPRNNAAPFVIEVGGYEEICCAKLGKGVPGAPQVVVGNVIYGVNGHVVTEFTVEREGIKLQSYSKSRLTLRPDCLRRMNPNGLRRNRLEP